MQNAATVLDVPPKHSKQAKPWQQQQERAPAAWGGNQGDSACFDTNLAHTSPNLAGAAPLPEAVAAASAPISISPYCSKEGGGGAGGGEANLEAGRASFGAPTCTLKRLEHLRTTPTRAQSCASCTSEGRAQARLAPAASPARPTLATSSGRFVEKMDCMVDQSNAPSAALCTPNSMTSWAKHSRCTPGMSTGGAGGEERSAEEAWGKGSRHAGT